MSKALDTDNWLVLRWQASLEISNSGQRMQRGRSYAKDGAVREWDLTPGMIGARVDGTRYAPYQVVIRFAPFDKEERIRLLDQLIAHPLYLAKLLADEMPKEMESLVEAAGVRLFPAQGRLETSCTCPDWVNPCKHSIAVYYAVGQLLAQDPFLWLHLHGIEREEVMDCLRDSWGSQITDESEEPAVGVAETTEEANLLASLPEVPPVEKGAAFLRRSVDQQTFWTAPDLLAQIPLRLTSARVTPDSLPLMWGAPAFFAKKGPVAVHFLAALMREVSHKAEEKIEQIETE